MNILTDRAQGGSSLSDGQVEMMVHRRLIYNGNGHAFNINEPGVDGKGLIVRGKHYLYFGPTIKTIEQTKKMAECLYMAPIVMFDKYSTIKEYSSQKEVTFEGLSHSLPENIHLLTLENWKSNQVLLRLEHTFEASDNSPLLSKPVEVNLVNLFKTFKVLDSVGTTLAANELLSESKRLNWNSHNSSNEKLSRNTRAVNTRVVLKPQEIKTFILTVENNNHKEGKPIDNLLEDRIIQRIFLCLEKCIANWVKTTQNNIPKNAYVGGHDLNGEPFNICRHKANNDLVAGKADKHLGCALTMSNKEVYIENNDEFEVFVANNVEWVPRHGTDPINEHALVVGTKEGGAKTYVGRCKHKTSVVVGKIDYNFYYGFSGVENKDCTNHEVLVCNS